MALSKPTNGSNADYANRIGLLFDAVNLLGYLFSTSCASFATAGVTRFLGMGLSSITENDALYVAPCAGTITRLRVQCFPAPGAGQTFTLTVRKNSVDQTMVGVINGAATFEVDVTTNPVTVADGDYISIKVVGSAGSAAASFRGYAQLKVA